MYKPGFYCINLHMPWVRNESCLNCIWWRVDYLDCYTLFTLKKEKPQHEIQLNRLLSCHYIVSAYLALIFLVLEVLC